MGLRKKFKDFRDWCPQPPNPLPTKLKQYSVPIAILLTVTLFTASFSIFYYGYPVHPLLPQVIVPLASSAPANETPPATQWVQEYTGQYPADYADRIIQTSDGGYILAGVTGSHLYSVAAVWLVKIDSQGNVEWNRTFTITSGNLTYNLESVAGFVQTSDGGFAIAGTEAWFPSGNSIMEYSTGSVAILFKTDSSGNIEWNQTYPYISSAASLVQTSDGGYAIAGDYSLVKTNSLGIAQWHKSYEDNVFKPNTINENLVSVLQTSDGGFALQTSDDILFKVTFSGNLQWKQTIQTSTSTIPAPANLIGYPDSGGISSYIQTSDGGYLLAGTMYIANSNSNFAALIKTDSKGAVEWTRTYGPSGSSATVLIQTSDGGYAFAGTVPGQGNYPQNYLWLVKTDSSGNLQWSQTNNDTSVGFYQHDNVTFSLGGGFSVNSLIETSDGGFMMAGSYDPNGVSLQSEYYLVKTDPSLRPPSPTPLPTEVSSPSPAPSQFVSNPVLLASLTIIVIVIVAMAVLLFRRGKRADTILSTPSRDSDNIQTSETLSKTSGE